MLFMLMGARSETSSKLDSISVIGKMEKTVIVQFTPAYDFVITVINYSHAKLQSWFNTHRIPNSDVC